LIDQDLLTKEREESFDKIISKFEISKIKENLQDHRKRTTDLKYDSPLTSRMQEKDMCFGSNVNQSIYTERVKNNLEKLRNHYCFLPEIGELKKYKTLNSDLEMEEDY
jgi:t-SNARE complex subunit (syntaxin)